MPMTALPTPPQRSDPTNFATRADAFMSALPTFATEATALEATVLAQASTVQAIASAVAWVSGTTYAIGDARWSPITLQTYRRITAGAGTTDPSLDGTNWAQLTGVVIAAVNAPTLLNSWTNYGSVYETAGY